MMKIVAVVLCLIGLPLSAGDMPLPLQNALSNMDKLDYSQYYYRMKIADSDSSSLEEFNPSIRDELKWNLLKVDGKKPSKEDIEKYRKRKQKELDTSKAEKEGSHTLNLQTMFKEGTISLVKEDEKNTTYSFRPVAETEDDKDIMEHVTGEVVLDNEKECIVSLTLSNQEAFSPVFSVKIKSFLMEMTFRELPDSGLYAVDSIRTEIDGRLMGLKKISEKALVEYIDYERVVIPEK